MLMRSLGQSFILATTLLACTPNLRDQKTVKTDEDSAKPEEKTNKRSNLNHPNQGFERLTFRLEIPVFLPEGATADNTARLLTLSCSPAVGIIEQTAQVTNEEQRQVLFTVQAESYSYDLNCKSLIVSDAKQRYFESEIREMIRIPKDEEDKVGENSDQARDLNVTVAFQPVALPQSALIESQIAREIALQESEKQRLEREAAIALIHQQQLEAHIRQIEQGKEQLSQAERELQEEKSRAVELEKIANQSLLERIEAEKKLLEAKEEEERLQRELERELALKREALEKLQEKEKQLAVELSRSRRELEQKKASLKTVELTEPHIVQCPAGSLLNLETMICE